MCGYLGFSDIIGGMLKTKKEFVYISYSSYSIYMTRKNIFTKMLKDVGMEVSKSIETRSKFSMHAGDDSMQQS